MARRITVIDAHPDPDPARFVHALAAAYVSGAIAAGHETRLIRLADKDIPVLRTRADWEGDVVPPAVADAQGDIAWAHHIVILYPLWLGEPPALLKAFLEQTLRPGFAFSATRKPFSGGQLKGRTARVVVTMGVPALVYRLWFGSRSLETLKRNILAFVGIGPTAGAVIGGVEGLKAAERQRWLDRLRRWGREGR